MLNATHNVIASSHETRNHVTTSPNRSPIKSKQQKCDPALLASMNHKTPPISMIDKSMPIPISRPQDDGPRARSGSHGLRDFLHRLRRTGSSAVKGGDASGAESPPLSMSVSPPNSNGLTVLHVEAELARPRTQSDATAVSHRLKRRATTGQAEGLSHRLETVSGSSGLRVSQSGYSGQTASSIGPQEFVAMYRARAYSDTKRTQLEAARTKALANARAQRVRTYSQGEGDSGAWDSPKPGSGNVAGMVNGFMGGANGVRGGSSGRMTGGSSTGTALSPLCNSGEAKEPRLIIWCDPHSGTSIFRLPTISVDSNETEKSGEENVGQHGIRDHSKRGSVAGLNAYLTLLKSCRCYDLIPRRSKIVILDSELKAGSALFALIQNQLRSALVWDSDINSFIGLLTVTDFIQVLLKFHSNQPDNLTSIENETLTSLRHCALGVKGHKSAGLVHVTSDMTLYEAVCKLSYHPVSRLPVVTMEAGDVIGEITASSLLDLLYASEATPPPFAFQSIKQLGVGTYGDDLVTVTEETALLVALETLVARRLSWLPVVDRERRPVGVYRKSAALNLALDESYCNVDRLIVGQVLTESCRQFEICRTSDSLMTVLNKLVQTGTNHLVVIGDSTEGRGQALGTVQGVVSASDVLYALVLNKPSTPANNQGHTHRNNNHSHTTSNTKSSTLSSTQGGNEGYYVGNESIRESESDNSSDCETL